VSRFNTLLHGSAEEAADALEDTPADEQELRVALQNALRRIAKLEDEMDEKVDKRWVE
jgi:hypothetical protein